ncbi:MAG: LAGLIDADG family homing endonuclease [Candidatus Diapherotrites archaeon]
MTKITQLKLKNFKSFKKAEIPFARGFTAIAGANASGKCVIGETMVALPNGEQKKISEIVKEKLENTTAKKFLEDGVIGFNQDSDFKVMSLNLNTLKLEERTVQAVVKRTAPKKLLKIRTRNGREITTTDYHPFFSVGKKGLYSLKASELKEKQFIATPRNLSERKKELFFCELLEEIEPKNNLYAPFNQRYLEIIQNYIKATGYTTKETAKEMDIPENAIKGLKDKQAINLAHLIKILKTIGFENEQITELVPIVKGKTSKKEIKMIWKNSQEFSRLLGYFFAEGSFSGKNPRLANESTEIIEDIKNICEKLTGKKVFIKKYKENSFDLIINSHAFYQLLSKFGLEEKSGARGKKIKEIFFKHSDKEELAAFLDGYLSGDGYISKSTVSSATASEELAKGIERIYLGLGIVPSTRKTNKKIKKTGFEGNYFEVTISGATNISEFTKKVSLTHIQKMLKIRRLCKKRKHTNTDLIPHINNIIKEACIENQIKYARKKNKNIKLKSYTDFACHPSRHGLQEVLQQEFKGKQSEKTVVLHALADSQVFWDQITSIKEVTKKPRHVYDLTVEETHNFVANNIIIHNSNILDALLFAIGITSLKMLRASRLTELVNHDSKDGYAKVELTLEDDNGKEIQVTRIIDKQGKSIYKLDGKRKTLNEIQSLLLEIGINPNGHNIVVQGDITRITEMNAKQRKRIIEEVAGLQEFEEKKEEAIKKLEKVEQKVKDATLVLNEREIYLQQLEQERGNALKYNELQEEVKRSKATILSEEIKIIKKELGGAKKQLDEMQKEIGDKRKERDKLQEEERELETKVEEATKKLIASSEKTYSGLGKEVEQKKGHLVLLNERFNSRNYIIEEKSARKEKLKEEEKETKKIKEEKEEQLKQASYSLEKTNEQLKSIQQHINSKSPKLEEKKEGTQSSEEIYYKLGKEIEELKEKLHEARISKNNHEKEINSAKHSLQELETRKSKLEIKIREKEELEKKIIHLEGKAPNERLEAKEKELEKLMNELHVSKGKHESIHEAIETLQQTKSECPICDKPLEKNTKETITGKKRKEIGELKTKIAELTAQREKIEEEKKKIKIDEKELAELKYSIKSFTGSDEEFASIKENITKLKETASSKEHEKYSKQEKELENKIDGLQIRRSEVEKKINDFKQSEANIEMNQLLHKMQDLNEQKNEKGRFVTELSTEIEKVLKHRLESIKEEEKIIEKELNETKKGIAEIREEKEKEEKELEKMEAELEKSSKANKLLEEEKDRLTTKIKNISEKRDILGRKIENQEKEVNEINLNQSKNEVRIVDLEEEFKDYSAVKVLSEFVLNDLKTRIPEIEKEVEKLGAINMKALENFDAYKKEVDDVREKATKLDEERKAVIEMIDKIEVKKLNVFMECFNHVSKKFSELYYNFFEGEGHLDLTDKESPLEGGLLIQAKYKEDVMKSIDAMSGGEKSLTAMAFLFAIQSFEPAPFYIFDEVDAALDKDNSIKVGKMIKGQSGYSQFISISHNDSVINQADQIIGVALNKQKSSIIGLKLKKETPSSTHAEA